MFERAPFNLHPFYLGSLEVFPCQLESSNRVAGLVPEFVSCVRQVRSRASVRLFTTVVMILILLSTKCSNFPSGRRRLVTLLQDILGANPLS